MPLWVLFVSHHLLFIYLFIHLFIVFNITQQDLNLISYSAVFRINKILNIKKNTFINNIKS